MRLKDYTLSIANKDTSLTDLAKDILGNDRIDWSKDDALLIISQIKSHIPFGKSSRTFEKFCKDYFQQNTIDDDL